MRRFFPVLTFLLLTISVLVLTAPVALAGDVRVTMNNGRVSVSAHDATLKEILDAWGREGQTAFVNADRIPTTAPITIEISDSTEEDALAVLLRPLSGYLAMRRASAPAAHASAFARVVLLPTSVANRDSAVIANNTPPPVFAPPAPPPTQTVMINGVARLIGPNGALIEDDQQDAPPPNNPRGFTRGDAPPPAPPAPPVRLPQPSVAPGVVGSPTPGVVIAPPPPVPVAPAQR